MTAKAGNGRFVKSDNPVAVIGRMNARREVQRAADGARSDAKRLADRRAHGYKGPLTREDVAR